MIYETMNTEFSTKDLHLAAYLKLKEVELLRLDKPDVTPKSPSFFVFADKQKCEALDKKFWEEGDFVNIKDYIRVVRDLRSRVASIPYRQNYENN